MIYGLYIVNESKLINKLVAVENFVKQHYNVLCEEKVLHSRHAAFNTTNMIPILQCETRCK